MKDLKGEIAISRRIAGKKNAEAHSMFLDQTSEDHQAKMQLSERMAKIGNAAVAALFWTTALCKRRTCEYGSRLVLWLCTSWQCHAPNLSDHQVARVTSWSSVLVSQRRYHAKLGHRLS